MTQRTFFWKGFAAGKPSWALPAIKLLGLLFLLHFVIFLVASRASSPEMMNGQFVLSDHGSIRQVISERQYLRLKGDELRMFATGWISFYIVTALYWWFPGAKPPTSRSEHPLAVTPQTPPPRDRGPKLQSR